MADGNILSEPGRKPGSFVKMKIVPPPSATEQTHLIFSDGQENIRPLWQVKVVSS